ncbi:MAG: hypothetical protein ACM3MK_02340 [Chitinophagales bacterium]
MLLVERQEQMAHEATFDEPKQHQAKLRPISSGGLVQPDVALPATTITDVVLAGCPPLVKRATGCCRRGDQERVAFGPAKRKKAERF